MKEPVSQFKGVAEFTRNTRHDSLGEVTTTVPVEVMAVVQGVLWSMLTVYKPPGKEPIQMYDSFLSPVWSNSKGVIPYDVRSELKAYYDAGREIGAAAYEVAKKYRR